MTFSDTIVKVRTLTNNEHYFTYKEIQKQIIWIMNSKNSSKLVFLDVSVYSLDSKNWKKLKTNRISW